jgi:hypothetical protein
MLKTGHIPGKEIKRLRGKYRHLHSKQDIFLERIIKN